MVRNRHGQSIDPVPFIVISGLGFMVVYSFFPVYCLSFGLEPPGALLVTTGIYLGVFVGAFYQLIWTARPDVRSEVSPGLRLETIFLGALIVTGVLLLLTLVHVSQ